MSTFQADFARIAQLQTRLRASQMQIEAARSQIISAKSKLSGQSGFGLSAVKAAIQQEVKTTAEERETAGRMRAFMGVVVDRTSQHENSAAGKLESTDIKKVLDLILERLGKIILNSPGVILGKVIIDTVSSALDGAKNLWDSIFGKKKKPKTNGNGSGGDTGEEEKPKEEENEESTPPVTPPVEPEEEVSDNSMTLENRNGQNFYSYDINPLHQDDFTEFQQTGHPENNLGCSVTAMMMLYLFLNPNLQLSYQDMETKMRWEWWVETGDPNTSGAVWGNAGFTSQDIKGEQAILSEAVNQLQQGKPSIIKIQGVGDDRHYVLIKGYREGCDFSHLTPDDILVQDPGFTADSATLTLREAMSHHPDSYLPGQLITC
ncbi:MAG: hypothetical protein HFG27_04440 [Provencibacterium sp.]|jgi:hypothetical protein|nr:hypothetical protein [Provencibacterium sp.]